MTKKMSKVIVSFTIALLMICSMAVSGKMTIKANAAGGTINIKIASVERMYSDSNRILEMINEYRKENNISTISMDKEHMEAAMVRAAELSLYASDYCPNGELGTSRIPYSSGGQIIAYDVRSLYAMFDSFKENVSSDGIILSDYFKSVGVGVVRVNGHKFVCILASAKIPEPVSESDLSRIVEINQELSTYPDLISDMSSVYYDGTGVSCGSSIPAYVEVRNQNYSAVSVYLTSYGATVSISNEKVFKHENGRLVAKAPGECKVKISYPGTSSGSVSFALKSIGKDLSSCKFPSIPDQIYTGKEIRPVISITDSSGARLEKSNDYELTYKNNIEVGTATVIVTGKGEYGGQSKNLYFKIVKGSDDPSNSFSVNVTSSLSELVVNDSVTISVIKSGGTAPFRYTYQYAPYGTSNWTTVKSDTQASLYSFTPKSSGKIQLRVNAVDGKGNKASHSVVMMVYPAMTLTASLSAKTVNKNDSVKITASAKGGKAPLQYSYYIQKPGASDWTMIKKYSDSQTAAFKAAEKGTYKVCVKLKGAVGDIVKKYLELEVKDVLIKNVSAISSKEIDLGQTISIKGKALNGSSVTYAYYYKKSSEENWHTISNYSTTTLVSFKPSEAGTYDIYVKAKDGSGNIAKAYFSVKVHKELTNTSKMSSGEIFLGKTVSFTFSAINGSGSYQYAIYCKKGSESDYKLLRDYSSDTSYTFKPDVKGNYYFKIKVKDSISNVVTKELSLKVYAPLTMDASVSSASIRSGQSVTVTASAAGGTSPYMMAVFLKKPGSTSFAKHSDYKSSRTQTISLSTKGTFTIRVKVKDSAGGVVSKDINVTVS